MRAKEYRGKPLIPCTLQYPLVNPLVHILKHIENHLLDGTPRVFNKEVGNGFHRYFGGQLVRETELARGDAAKGDAFKTFFIGQLQDGTIARCQLFLLERCWNAVWDNGADSVDDVFARKIVRFRDFGGSRGFQMSLLLHQLVAFLT